MKLFRKIMVFSIIGLFIGAGVVQGNYNIYSQIELDVTFNSNYSPPIPEITLDGDELEPGVYKGRVTVRIQVSSGFPCDYDIYYILDGVQSAVSGCTFIFSVSEEGTHSIICWSKYSNGGMESDHTGIQFTIVNEPERPSIYGPTSGLKIGKEYEYGSWSRNTDTAPNYFIFDWGDGTDSGWLGPFNPGQQAKAFHIWNEIGEYTICVKVKDSYNLESKWECLSVFMPKNKAINTPFLYFLENQPYIFPILKQLMQHNNFAK